MLQQILSDTGMIGRGNRKADGIDFAEEFVVIGHGLATMSLGNLGCASGLNVDYANKFDTWNLRVQAGMMLAKMTDSDNS